MELDNRVDFWKMEQGTRNIEQQRCRNCGGKNHPSEECPHRNKGTRCFRCNEFGHIGKHCQASRTSEGTDLEGTDSVNKVDDKKMETGIHLSSWRLHLEHGKVNINAVICTGTKYSFLRMSKFMELEYAPARRQPATIEQLFGTDVRTLGSYELHLNNGDEGHYIQCHIIQDESLPEEMVLGMSFIEGVEIVISKGRISVRRATNSENENEGAVGGGDYTIMNWHDQMERESLSEVRQLLQDGRVGSGTVSSAQLK